MIDYIFTQYPYLSGAAIGALSGFIHLSLLIVVHELGHLFFGRLSGYEFQSFQVQQFLWQKEGDKIRFVRKKSGLGGQCVMAPPPDPETAKYFAYNAGGGIFNLLFAALLWLLSLAGAPHVVNIFLIVGIGFNLLLGAAMNLVPLKLNGVPNDGLNIYTLFKSKDAQRGFYWMMWCATEIGKGRRYRDFESFEIPEDADLNNYFVAYWLILEGSRYADRGEYDKALEIYQRVNLDPLPAFYRHSINLMLLSIYSQFIPDYEKARVIYENKKLKKFLKTWGNEPSFASSLAEYEWFVLKDREKAEARIQIVRNGLGKEGPGARAMLEEGVALLEEDMRGEETAPETPGDCERDPQWGVNR